MKKFLTGAFTMAVVGGIAAILVYFWRSRKVLEIARKNVEVKETIEGRVFVDVEEREAAVGREVQKVSEMQIEEVMDAWTKKFGS